MARALGFDVVGETGDGLEAMALVERLRPAIVTLNLELTGLDGLEVARRLADLGPPRPHVLLLSQCSSEAVIAQALRNVDGFVTKDAATSTVARALQETAAGKRHVPASWRPTTAGAAADAWERLTNREREVTLLVGNGSTNRDVADRLGISVRTVEVHRRASLTKLGLHGPVELARYVGRRTGHLG